MDDDWNVEPPESEEDELDLFPEPVRATEAGWWLGERAGGDASERAGNQVCT